MMNPEITTSLQSVFDRIFKEPSLPISHAFSAQDIDGWDSFTHLNLIQEIETEFKIEFKLKELMNMNNVGDIIKIIENKFKVDANLTDIVQLACNRYIIDNNEIEFTAHNQIQNRYLMIAVQIISPTFKF